ncbi:MAG: lysophospholipid acyltransferase family protein [Duncaniella sp.]|nr:lysophospholipid acyltransferase family protein [Muribaculum sp.]MCM1255489.1 lysophospholipid acyltransferase family protein [Duncaniella sp.]
MDQQSAVIEDKKPVKRTVLDYDDIVKMVPFFKGKKKLVNFLMKMLDIDKVNWIHDHNFDTPGPQFCRGLLEDLDIKLRIDNEQVLDNLPEGAFITVSNHPFGALDGITLIDIVGSRRPGFKVMVNMILNYIVAMRPNFIAVDQAASEDPNKKAVSMQGIKEAIRLVRSGEPVGFFPAGAVGNYNKHFKFEDREWRPSIIRLIQQLKVPVIPIFFHGYNSWWFRFLGIISWQLRTFRLPAEVFRRKGDTLHISVGDPISVEEIKAHSGSVEELGAYLKSKTYELQKIK